MFFGVDDGKDFFYVKDRFFLGEMIRCDEEVL